MSNRSPVPIAPVKVVKGYDALASSIRDRIISGDLSEGSVLPGERDLVEQTGLGRSSVREALRVLSAEGLVRTTTGRYGGSTVQNGGDRAIARLVDLFIQGRRIPFTALLETRQAIEPMLAQLAAQNRTDADIERLQQCTAAMEEGLSDPSVLSDRNIDWHLAVAAASHNELLTAMMAAIAGACRRAGILGTHGSPEVVRPMIEAHRAILAAIVAGDAAAAQRRMVRHLTAYSLVLGAAAPAKVDL